MPAITPSSELVYQDGMKYRLAEDFVYELELDYGLTEDFHHPLRYYSVVKKGNSWFIIVRKGCCWDGATMYFDWKWMMYPSLVHDVLHWLIKRGVIDEIYNDRIDEELRLMVLGTRTRVPFRKIRARAIQKATHLANEKRKKGTDFPIKRIQI
jgi:hypothetical protein